MKNLLKGIAFTFCIALTMSSCYTLTYNVGNGAQTGIEVKEKIIILLQV